MATPTPKSKLSKFILSLPTTLTATEVVSKAKAQGLKTSPNNVYRVRRLFGAGSRMAPSRQTAKPVPSSPAKPSPRLALRSFSSSAEDLLKAVAVEIGLGRAVEILAGERARVKAVIGG
jgi:hypothetical protein